MIRVKRDDPEQVAIPANLFYDDRELTLMWFRPAAFFDALVWEEGDPPTPGMLFPHLYDELDLSLSHGSTSYRRDNAGRFGTPEPPA